MLRWIVPIALCMAATAAAAETGWRMVVYDGDVVKSTDTAVLSEQVCKARADANNHAFQAGRDAARAIRKEADQGPRLSVKCEEVPGN